MHLTCGSKSVVGAEHRSTTYCSTYTAPSAGLPLGNMDPRPERLMLPTRFQLSVQEDDSRLAHLVMISMHTPYCAMQSLFAHDRPEVEGPMVRTAGVLTAHHVSSSATSVTTIESTSRSAPRVALVTLIKRLLFPNICQRQWSASLESDCALSKSQDSVFPRGSMKTKDNSSRHVHMIIRSHSRSDSSVVSVACQRLRRVARAHLAAADHLGPCPHGAREHA